MKVSDDIIRKRKKISARARTRARYVEYILNGDIHASETIKREVTNQTTTKAKLQGHGSRTQLLDSRNYGYQKTLVLSSEKSEE